MASKYDPETRARAVRLVLDHRDDYPSEWAAITAVSERLGMTAETLRSWIRRHQVDEGERDGVSSDAAAEIRALKRRNVELEQTIEILKRQRVSSCGRATRATAADSHGLRVHRREQGSFRVAPICRVLCEHGMPIAPRTFHAWATRAPSKRALWDATITHILAGCYEPDEQGRRTPESLYGSLKMRAPLQREGIPVAKSTVERLMRKNGWQGVRRWKKVRTTIPDPEAVRPPDLVGRQFGVPARNLLLVADFTYVKLVTGIFVYVAFVIDAYAGAILGWEASASKHTASSNRPSVRPPHYAAARGHPIDGAIHHSDAGSQFTAQAMVKACAGAGLRRSMGATGICWDNSGAESLWSTFKHEYYYRHTFGTKTELVAAVDEWMRFYNAQRRHSVIGMLSPIAYEQSLDAVSQAA